MSAGFRWNDADSLVGGFLVAVATGTFRVESFGDRQDLTRHLSGAGGHIQGQETLGGPLLAEAGWNRIVYAADGPAPTICVSVAKPQTGSNRWT